MVLVFAESQKGQFKKTAFEAVSYGSKSAKALGTTCVALTIGDVQNGGQLGVYGAEKVYHLNNPQLSHFDTQIYSQAISKVAQHIGATVIIVSHSSTGKALLGRIGVNLNAGTVSAATEVPTLEGNSFKVKKNVFSGKAIAEYEITSPVKVLSLLGNSVPLEETGTSVEPENLNIEVDQSRIQIIEVKKQDGDVAPLPEAELVVSAGRGMKSPENWDCIEELAKALGATTACSRPVADSGWRPHHEHVGQTGVAIKPNLYIAAGISGAIQHLAGVNSSKCIVVINKDPEAPFFKAADYGVCADLFEVVPRLTEAINKAKG